MSKKLKTIQTISIIVTFKLYIHFNCDANLDIIYCNTLVHSGPYLFARIKE